MVDDLPEAVSVIVNVFELSATELFTCIEATPFTNVELEKAAEPFVPAVTSVPDQVIVPAGLLIARVPVPA